MASTSSLFRRAFLTLFCFRIRSHFFFSIASNKRGWRDTRPISYLCVRRVRACARRTCTLSIPVAMFARGARPLPSETNSRLLLEVHDLVCGRKRCAIMEQYGHTSLSMMRDLLTCSCLELWIGTLL